MTNWTFTTTLTTQLILTEVKISSPDLSQITYFTSVYDSFGFAQKRTNPKKKLLIHEVHSLK